jgi:hypothetical protein
MTNADKPRFAKAFAVLAENYAKEVSASLPEIYFTNLSQYSIEQVEVAAHYLMRKSTYWPTIAHFVEAIEGSPEDKAAGAWSLLVEALRKFGAYASLEIVDDGAWVYALEQTFGSWIHAGDTLPDSNSPMYASLRKQFMGAYRAYERSGREVALPRRLKGRHEVSNGDWATWRPGLELPPQPAYRLSEAGWQQASLVLDRERGGFFLSAPKPRLLPGGGPKRIGGGNATGN